MEKKSLRLLGAALLWVGPIALAPVALAPVALAEDTWCPAGPVGGDEDIDAVLRDERAAQHIVGLTVAVVVDGEVAYLSGDGFAAREHGEAVLPEYTLFRLASVSKTVTAVAAMLAVQEGYLNLDLPITAYYPDYRLPRSVLAGDGWGGEPGLETEPMPEDAELTLRHLLSHQGGVQHYSNGVAKPTPNVLVRDDPDRNTGFEWALRRWVWAPLLTPPGEAYSYSTMGFNLAGVVIGEAWKDGTDAVSRGDDVFQYDLVEQRIAEAVGAPGLQPDYMWLPKRARSEGYLIVSPDLTTPDTFTDVSWKLPGGGFMASAWDMGCYARALLGDDLLTSASKEAMWTKQRLADGSATGYGLGWNVGSRDGRRRVSHNGEQEGATSRLVLYPDEGLAFVVLTNTRSATGEVSINLTRLLNEVEDVVRDRVDAGLPPILAP